MVLPRLLFAPAAALVGTIVWQLSTGPGTEPLSSSTAAAPAAARPAPEPPARDAARGWAEAALARPLFQPGRRPAPPAEAAPRPAAEDLPRLTALVSGPFGRRAIFAGMDGRSAVVTAGSTLNGWTVLSIGVGAVSVAGRDGERTIPLRRRTGAPEPTPAPPTEPVDEHAGGGLLQRPTAGPMFLPPAPLQAGRR